MYDGLAHLEGPVSANMQVATTAFTVVGAGRENGVDYGVADSALLRGQRGGTARAASVPVVFWVPQLYHSRPDGQTEYIVYHA